MTEKKHCPKCGSKNIDISDAGYSSFNIGTAKCLDCSFSIQITCSCFPTEEIISAWNETVDFIEDVDCWSKDKLKTFVKAAYLNTDKEKMNLILKKVYKNQIFKETCFNCNGTGTVYKKQGFLQIPQKCSICKGSGEF